MSSIPRPLGSIAEHAFPSRSTLLDRSGLALAYLVPPLMIVGRAPADVAASLIALIFLARSTLDSDWRWLRTPWLVLSGILWVGLCVLSIGAADPQLALARSVPWIRYLIFAAALQHWLLTTPGTRRTAALAIGGSLGIVVLVALAEFAGAFGPTGNRLQGPFSGLVVGHYITKLAFPALGALAGAALARPSAIRLPLLGAIALLAGTVFASGERMPLLLFVFGMVLFTIAIPGLRRPMMAAWVATVIAATAALFASEPLRDRLLEHTPRQLALAERSDYGMIFSTAAEMWRRNPVIGVGPKNYREVCPDPVYDRFGPREMRCQLHPHNVYLEWAAETGTVGLVGFLALIAAWAREAWTGFRRGLADRPLAEGAAIGVVLFLWPLASSMSFFSNWNATLFWFALGLMLAASHPRPGRG